MKKVLFIFSIFVSFLYSLDLSDFDVRQKVLMQVKEVVLKEEQMAKAYENYILEKYALPSNSSDLETSDFLGTSFLNIFSNSDYSDIFNKISISSISTLSYALKSELQNDSFIKNMYESNSFRKNTFYSSSKISFIIKDDFAKHLLYLLSKQTSGIPDCTTNKKYCKTGNTIFIYDGDNHTTANKLMYYHKDKFKTGPIIITKDKSLQTTNEEFDFIPRGALLYDEDGKKYVKTLTSIEEVR